MQHESFPPNPKELDITWFISLCRISETGDMLVSSSGCWNSVLAGMKLWQRDKMEKTASIAPAALVVCPVYDFVEEKGGTFPLNTFWIARLS